MKKDVDFRHVLLNFIDQMPDRMYMTTNSADRMYIRIGTYLALPRKILMMQ